MRLIIVCDRVFYSGVKSWAWVGVGFVDRLDSV